MKIRIGIFDSGIGGFTILKSLLKSRNDVEVFYLADTKRIPFGNKSFYQIRNIAKDICNWFEDKNLDALLIACNTTNACALDILEKTLKVPCFDLIHSSSEIINKGVIGVLATPTTIKSSYYKKVLCSKNENLIIYQQECPEFVTEIERNKLNLKKLNYLSKLYLTPLLEKKIQHLILGCSHYPLIKEILINNLNPKIKVIDPSKALVQNLNKSFLIPKKYSSHSISYESVHFFVTANNIEFSKKVKNWLEINKEISLVNLRSNE